MVPTDAPPLTQVAIDLIIGLLKSQGYNSVLTIVDHGCLQGVLFLPCQSMITGPQITKLYYQHLYLWFGLPRHMITNRDRSLLHLSLWESASQGARDNLKLLHHVPPTNRWTLGEKESVAQTVSPTSVQQSNRLAHHAYHHIPDTQQYLKLHYRLCPQPPDHWPGTCSHP